MVIASSEGMKKILKNENGFSLMEASMSTVILGFAFMVGVATMNNATIANANLDSRVIASQFANEKIEMIMADNYLQPTKYSYIVAANYPDESLKYGTTNGAFTREVDITEVSSSNLNTPLAGSGMKKVEVTVSWGNQNYQKVKLTTLVTSY